MRRIILIGSLLLLTACSADPGSEDWCKAKNEQSKTQWSGDDAMLYAKHCVFNSQTIGSKEWCIKLEEKPKSDWTASDAGDYAKHCVI